MVKYKKLKQKKGYKRAYENLREIEDKIEPYTEEKYYERKKIERWDVYKS
ncbi:MAG: hypothetical protein GF317_00130 [Candidatus Lokiarchaeota archaeon]|nr:hypothetical protein [Candidatus Lokiarchaeota archaeon]MBD3198390.1 hypothetical protein [Candidatus Lokiarchaeota archaeon]